MNTQPTLFDAPRFAGKTVEAVDVPRLTSLLHKVFAAMKSGQWLTLREIQAITGGSEAGVSARIRDLRKPGFGGYTVERRRRGNPALGIWEYRLVI